MIITRVVTLNAVISLDSAQSFDIKRQLAGRPLTIQYVEKLNCVRINNTLIPMANIREIVIEEPTVNNTIEVNTEIVEKVKKKQNEKAV